MSPTTFLLQVRETLKDDAFMMGETVSYIWEIITRIAVAHVRFSINLHAEDIAASLCWKEG
jgi:hypothetical protein